MLCRVNREAFDEQKKEKKERENPLYTTPLVMRTFFASCATPNRQLRQLSERVQRKKNYLTRARVTLTLTGEFRFDRKIKSAV